MSFDSAMAQKISEGFTFLRVTNRKGVRHVVGSMAAGDRDNLVGRTISCEIWTTSTGAAKVSVSW